MSDVAGMLQPRPLEDYVKRVYKVHFMEGTREISADDMDQIRRDYPDAERIEITDRVVPLF